MKREFVIGGIFFAIFFVVMVFVTIWGGKSKHPSQTTVSVEEGTVEVYNAADPKDVQVLRRGEQVRSSRGLLFGIEPIPPAPDESNTIVRADQPVDSTQAQSFQSNASSRADVRSSTEDDRDRYWVAGYVKGEDGKPLVGAKILLHNIDKEDEGQWYTDESEGRLAGKAVTDSKGYYAIQVNGPQKMQISSIPATDYLSLYDRIALTELQKNVAKHFVHPEAKLRLRGVALNKETDEPIEGAHIGVICRQSVSPNICAERAESGEDGSFLIKRLIRGVYRLEAMAEGYVRFDPHDKENDEFLNLDINEQTQDKVYTIKLKPGFAATVVVRDSEGQPVEGAELYFMRDTDLFWYVGYGKTDARGQHKNTQLPKDTLVVQAKKDGYGMEVSDPFEPGERDNPTSVHITLTKSGSISGTVADTKGKPVKGRLVYAETHKIGDWSYGFYEDAKTGEDGAYTIDGLSAGTYRVSLTMGDSLPAGEQTFEVELEEGGSVAGVDFTVKETDGVRGKVVDLDGNPVAGASISVCVFKGNERLSGAAGRRTNAEGEFTYGGLPIGDRVRYVVDDDKHARLVHEEPMDAEYVVLTLLDAGSLRGTVMNMRREPIAGAKVWRITSDGGVDEKTVVYTRADGTFSIEGLETSASRYGVSAEGYTETQTDVIYIEEGQDAHAGVIVLEEGVELSGVVVDPQGVPVAGAAISFKDVVEAAKPKSWGDEDERYVNPAQFKETTSGPDGGFQLSHVPSVGTELIVIHDRFAPAMVPITPTQIGQAAVTIRLTPGGAIEGVVLDEKGEPLSGSFIRATHGSDELFSVMTTINEKGEYFIDKLMSGRYTVLKRPRLKPFELVREFKSALVEEGKTVRCDFGKTEGASVRGIVYRNDAPVGGVSLSLSLLSFGRNPTNACFTAVSDEGGNYVFRGLEPGTYQLTAMEMTNGMPRDLQGFGFWKTFTIQEEQKDIRIDVILCSYEVRVRAVDADTNESLSGVVVQGKRSMNGYYNFGGVPMENKTGDDGGIALSPNGPGHYEYTAAKEGYMMEEFSADFPEPALGSTSQPVEILLRMQKQESFVLASVNYDNAPLNIPGTICFYWLRDGVQYELPFVKDEQPGLYRLTGMPEGRGELTVSARVLRQQLISLPQELTAQSDRLISVVVDLLDSYLFTIKVETPDQQILKPPVYYEILDLPQPVRQSVIIHPHVNVLSLSIPKGPYRVRLYAPGYQPAEFMPDALAEKEGRIEYAPFVRNMKVELIPE